MLNPFIQLSLVVLIVLGVSFLMRLFKQPLIIGYILSGIIVGPLVLNLVSNKGEFAIFAEIGVAFLLFLVGLHLNPKVIKDVGKISIITGIGQVLFTSIVGYLICLILGFNSITSIYIAVALTFSSTIIIMKLLSDKEALDKLYGKISVGFLLIQDLIAIIILIVLSSFSKGANATETVLLIFLKGILAFIVLFIISKFVLPKLNSFFEKSQEFLFIFSIAWGFGISALFYYIGLSIEVGALIAGILLSMFPYSYETSARLKPLRDFFLIIFFILLGSQMVFVGMGKLILPAIILSLFILIGNPLIVMILMGIFGYSKNTGFLAGLTVAQISEFSLILIALGVKIGHLSNEILSFVTIIGLITIAGSTYMLIYSEKLYNFLKKPLSIFEKKKMHEKKMPQEDYDYFLLGENRIGLPIMKSLRKNKKKYLVIDFDPEVIKRLTKNKIKCIYGDVSDIEFLEEMKISKAKVIISTIPDKETNLEIIKMIRKNNKKNIIISTAQQIKHSLELYSAGADYVILPQLLGGEHAVDLLENLKENKDSYLREKEKQIRKLK